MVAGGRMVEFQAGSSTDGRLASGYLIVPEEGGVHPGLIVVHEWWGLNDHIKEIAGRFAAEGYVAFAPDLYDGKITKDPELAAKYMQSLDQGRALETLSGAVSFLQSQQNVNGDKIGVTGFCMGGSFALLLPCHNKEIKAAAPFYGDVPPEDMLRNLSAPVLFIGAENDLWITQDKMEKLREGLEKFGKEGQVKVYPGVGHAFFNDTRPEAYDRQSAVDAWQLVNQFFEEKLR